MPQEVVSNSKEWKQMTHTVVLLPNQITSNLFLHDGTTLEHYDMTRMQDGTILMFDDLATFDMILKGQVKKPSHHSQRSHLRAQTLRRRMRGVK